MDENTHELKRAKIISKIKEMRLMDDDFMTAVLSDKACAELVIRIILDRDDITVKETKTQYTINSLRTHSVRLDVYAEDTQTAQSTTLRYSAAIAEQIPSAHVISAA